jgi:hypothetical protein
MRLEQRIDAISNQISHRAMLSGGQLAEFLGLGLRQEDLRSHHHGIITQFIYIIMLCS